MEFEQLIASFYDLPINEKDKIIHGEISKIKDILDTVMQSKSDFVSNKLTKYNSSDDNNDTLVKIYHDLILIEESLLIYLKSSGY